MTFRATVLVPTITLRHALAQAPPPAQPDWAKLQDETCSLTRRCCASTPGILPATRPCLAEYVKRVLEKEASPAQIVGSDRSVCRTWWRGLKGNGKKRPLLIMGPPKRRGHRGRGENGSSPPFSAKRGRRHTLLRGEGTVDDKDNLTARAMSGAV